VGLADEVGAGLGEEHVADGDGEGIASGLDCVDDGLGLGWGLADVAPASSPIPTATAARMAIAVNSRLMPVHLSRGEKGLLH
jgi:hypothetical protein